MDHTHPCEPAGPRGPAGLGPSAPEAAPEADGEAWAALCHEIRTPLGGVLGMAEALARTPLDAAQSRMLGTIRAAGRDLMALLDAGVEIGRIEAEAGGLERARFDPRASAEQVAALFAPAARAKGLALRLKAAPDLPPRLMGDGRAIRQVLANLVSNAVKFTDAGAVTLALRMERTGARPLALVIEVRDTGRGVPEGLRRAILAPYERGLHGARGAPGADRAPAPVEGAGLGLAIAARLCALHGGGLGVGEAPGGGARVTARFAVEAAEPIGAPIGAPSSMDVPMREPAERAAAAGGAAAGAAAAGGAAAGGAAEGAAGAAAGAEPAMPGGSASRPAPPRPDPDERAPAARGPGSGASRAPAIPAARPGRRPAAPPRAPAAPLSPPPLPASALAPAGAPSPASPRALPPSWPRVRSRRPLGPAAPLGSPGLAEAPAPALAPPGARPAAPAPGELRATLPRPAPRARPAPCAAAGPGLLAPPGARRPATDGAASPRPAAAPGPASASPPGPAAPLAPPDPAAPEAPPGARGVDAPPRRRLAARDRGPPLPLAHDPARALVPEDDPLRVLVAEDDATNRAVIAAMIAAGSRRSRVRLAFAREGREALAMLEAGGLDGALLDMRMPGLDGAGCARLQRAREADWGLAALPLVACSADAMPHQIARHLAAGFDRHLPKPLRMEGLEAALAWIAGRRAAVRAPEGRRQTLR